MKYYARMRPTHDWEYAKKAVEAGMQGFELVNWRSYYPREEFASYLELVARIKKELQVGFTVHAPVLDVNLGSLNGQMRAAAQGEIRASLDWARSLGAFVVIVHAAPAILAMPAGGQAAGGYAHPPWKKELLARQEGLLVRSLQELADYAPDRILALKNLILPHELTISPEDLQELILAVNRPNVGVTFDAGHASVAGLEASAYLHLLEEHLFHIHLHDNLGLSAEHLPLGSGTVDYVGLIQTLEAIEYLGVATLDFDCADADQFTQYLLQLK